MFQRNCSHEKLAVSLVKVQKRPSLSLGFSEMQYFVVMGRFYPTSNEHRTDSNVFISLVIELEYPIFGFKRTDTEQRP